MDYLFNASDLNVQLNSKKRDFTNIIAGYDRKEIAKKDIRELTNLIFSYLRIKEPKLRPDQASIVKTLEVEILTNDYGRKIKIPGTAIIIEVPFEGNPDYLLYKPSTYLSVFPQGDIQKESILLTYPLPKDSKEDIKLLYKKDIELIQEYLLYVKRDVDNFNNDFKQLIEQEVKKRKELLTEINKQVSELDLPFKETPITTMEKKLPAPEAPSRKVKYDAFISHATEDKDIVRPIAKNLSSKGFKIWFDEFELKIGDSLRKSIDRGLLNSKYGVVILSKSFFEKKWSEYELNGLIAKEIDGKKAILPIWYKITREDVLNYSPTLADRFALSMPPFDIDSICHQLEEVLKD